MSPIDYVLISCWLLVGIGTVFLYRTRAMHDWMQTAALFFIAAVGIAGFVVFIAFRVQFWGVG